MLSKELIDELKIILNEEFNLTLSDEELHRFAHSLVGFFSLLLKKNLEPK